VFQPDWIVGLSDTWYGWLSHHIARHTGARLAVDAYDNYESYMPWNLPLHYFWRRAIAAADVVTAAGPQLAALLDRHRSKRTPSVIIPMAADPTFVPFERNAARTRMELPLEAPLVGYFGSWAGNRSTDILLEAFRIVREQKPAARFVLSGRPPKHALSESGVLALGYIEDELLPIALSALDVACVITANTSFGRYSYPAKLCEAMACNVPVVATATEPVRWMLHDDSRFLVSIGDARKIAVRILDLLDHGRIAYRAQQTWADSARLFDAALHDASAA
jgi:glycosyltransferase involved in cell wall biosynthesis